MKQLRNHRSVVLAAATGLVALMGADLAAQSPISIPTPPNAVLLLIAEAEKSVADQDFVAAADTLQQLLDLQEDYFDPRAEGRSIKQRAERSLRLLPAAGMQAYQRRYGPEAETLLAEAMRFDDVGKLNEVIRRFAMTDSGATALELVANRLLDGGELLSAGRLFDRLIEHPHISDSQRAACYARASVCWWGCGNRPRARDRLVAWTRHAEGAGASSFLAGTADPAAVSDWLEQWSPQLPESMRGAGEQFSMLRGDPQRSGVLDRATPAGGSVWSYPAIDHDDCWNLERIAEVTSELNALEGSLRAEMGAGHPLLPSGLPVIAGDRVVFRGYGTVKWVDQLTGDPIWYSADRDATFKYLVEDNWRPVGEDWHRQNLKLFLGQRGWRDLTSGVLTCDDRYVYSIFHSGVVSPMGASVQNVAGLAPHALAPRPYNLLAAYDLNQCTLKWELGGAPGLGNGLEGAFFLGPPLAVDGRLYCLVDDRSQVRLIVINPDLDPVTEDEVVWEQSLYNPEHHLSSPRASPRRLSGLTPSASGDVLVCPTGEAALVAVDRRTRRLLWTHEYREVLIDPRARRFVPMLGRQPDPEQQVLDDLLKDDHWCESAPIIAGEFVVYTPPDHDELLCLRLTDGRLMWRTSRQDGIYVGGTYDGNVIVVGTNQVRAVRLSDGEPAWDESIPIPTPSGRGFQHDRFYVLPLSSGEIASIDLQDARMLTRSPTSGWLPGNLLSARGRIFSQTAAGLVAFRSQEDVDRQVRERLAVDPDDTRALALRGEQRLHLGDVSSGISDLRRSLAASDDPRVRAMLASTLIEGLRVDFADYREAADEIDRLVRDPAQRATFLRLLADGLQRSGDSLAAFSTWLRFAGSEIREQLHEGTDGRRLVQSDRWVRVRMEDLYSQSRGPSRAALDELMGTAIAGAVDSGDVNRLGDLLIMLPSTARTASWRLALVDQLDPRESASEMEMHLLAVLAASDPDLRGAAAARLLNLYLEERIASPVSGLVARLSGPHADRQCLNSRTGAQLLEEWGDDPERRKLLEPTDPWPLAHVEVDTESAGIQPPMYPLEHLGPTSLTLRDWRFYIDAAGTSLLAYDEQGADRWSHTIGQRGVRGGQRGSSGIRYIRTLGRMVLLVTNDDFCVLDALAPDGQQRVLVRNQLYQNDSSVESVMRLRVLGGLRINPRGALRNQVRTMNNRTNGNVGPLLAGGLVYQQGSTIRSIDPLTGEELWQRQSPEVPPGAEIMADDEFVVLWPPDRNRVVVLRAADGALHSQVNLPAHVLEPQPDGDWGRCVVLEERPGQSTPTRLALFDPVRQETVWELPVDDLLDWTIVDGRDFALLRAGGHFTLIDGLTGDERLTHTLGDPLAREIAVERLHDQLLVMTTSNDATARKAQLWPEFDFPHVHGDVALLSLDDGQIVWSRRVEHQTYMRHLPGRWPVLAFATNIIEPGRVAGQNYTSVLLLSRKTGDVICEQTWNSSANKYGWLARPDRNRLHISIGVESVALRFSNEPPESLEDNPVEDDRAAANPR